MLKFVFSKNNSKKDTCDQLIDANAYGSKKNFKPNYDYDFDSQPLSFYFQ